MPIKEKDIKRYSAILFIILLGILAIVIIKPIFLAILGGLILAYIFYPLYKRVYAILREKNTSALAVCVLIVVVVFVPLWFVVPVMIRQIFDMFNFLQTINIASFIKTIFPTASQQLQIDVATAIVSFVGKITTSSLSGLTGFLLDLPNVLLSAAVMIFVFYFAMRDAEKLKDYIRDLSPLKKEKSALLAQQFKSITNSVIYGNFIIGIVQGICTGIGLLIFGVPRPLVLTLFATFAAILPILGPWIVWIPVAIYLFSIGHTGAAIGFAIYSIIIVSTIDNVLRPYLIARKTKSSSVIVLIGMLGGLMVFGIIGFIIGPLILEYVVLFLDAYRNKTLADMFEAD